MLIGVFRRNPASISVSVSAAALVLSAVMIPQVILRAVYYTDAPKTVVASFLAIMALVGIALWSSQMLYAAARLRSAHQLAERYIDHSAGLAVAAARILAYALLIMLGVELAFNSLNATLNINWPPIVQPAVILVLALPALLDQLRGRGSLTLVVAVVAAVGLTLLISYGLVQELRNAINFEEVQLARKDALSSDFNMGRYFPLLEGPLGGAFLSAVVLLICERVMRDQRRVTLGTLIRGVTPAMILIAFTLYFVVILRMPGRRFAVPSLSMAYALGGESWQTILAVLYVALGLSVAYLAYRQLPRLLRELALDGLLPRRLAAKDSVLPRRMIVAIIGVLAAVVTFVLDSSRSISMVFVFTIYISHAVTSWAMIARSKTILHDSTHAETRSDATKFLWAWRFQLVVCGLVIAAACYAQPSWTLAGVTALSVPVVFLLIHARGQRKLRTQLQLVYTGEGRTLPTRVHGVVIIERLDESALKAVTWARSMRLSSLTAVAVDIDPRQTKLLRQAWQSAQIPVMLTVLGEPKGAVRGPVIDYIRERLTLHPSDIINVIIPRVVSTGSWRRFFVRHTTPRIVSELRYEPRVMLSEVPYRVEAESE